MIKPKLTIGIAGICGSGKDTLYSLLAQRINCKRVALADQLRREMNPFIIDKFGIDLFNCSREEKDLVRPLLVEYGRIKRQQTNGRYFIEKIDSYIKTLNTIAVISDVRYCVYERDETHWIKNELNGILVHVSKYKEIDGKKIFSESPIKDERENDPKLQAAADYKIEWPEVKTLDLLAPYVDNFLIWLQSKNH